MKLTFAVSLALALVAAPCAEAQNVVNDEPLGPIAVRNARPYNLLFLQFVPENPTVLPRAAVRLEVQGDIINNLLRPHDRNGVRVIEDNEMQRLRLIYRRGLGHRLEVTAQVALLSRNGGLLDGPISAYHRLLGLVGSGVDNPRGREFTPRGESILFWQNADGAQVDAANATGIGDVMLTLKREVSSPQSRARLALRAGVKLPTGSARQLLGSGAADAGLGLDARYDFSRRVILFASLGGIVMGRATQVPQARRAMVQGALGLEVRLGRRDSLLLQLDSNSRAVTTGHSFVDGAQTSATVGYKHVIKNGRAFSISFSENGDFHNYRAPILGNIGPDYTLSVGYQWQR